MTVRGGRYELLRPIASGGMATVHLARALGVGGFERFVAVKVMHQNIAGEAEFVAMFLDEARLAARIRHPNVVGTLDVGEDEQGLFLVMEYVEGPSLHSVNRALVKARREMPIDVALRIFTDALSGLHAAHEQRDAEGTFLNLVHRDVSPHNILIGIDGVAQITDFGVARAESRLQSTRSGVVKGKVSYMAPEQIKSLPIDRRADVFAAGALLWELLTHKRRIVGDNDAAMMHKILAGQPESPRDVNPTVPAAISDACMRALALPPDDRFPTAAAFAEALEHAASLGGISIASARGLSSFVKDLGIEQPSPNSIPSSSKPRDARPSGGTPSKGTGPHVPPSSATEPDSTHGAIVAAGAVSSESTKRTARARVPAIVGGVALVGVAVWLFTLGPLKVTVRSNEAPPRATSDAASANGLARDIESERPSSVVSVHSSAGASGNPSAVASSANPLGEATSTTSSSPPSSATPSSARPASKPRVDAAPARQEPNPAGFRPKEL